MPEDSEYERDQLRLRHCAARDAWKRRYETTPKGITWAQWFKNKFGLTLYEYHDWLKKRKEQDANSDGV